MFQRTECNQLRSQHIRSKVTVRSKVTCQEEITDNLVHRNQVLVDLVNRTLGNRDLVYIDLVPVDLVC